MYKSRYTIRMQLKGIKLSCVKSVTYQKPTGAIELAIWRHMHTLQAVKKKRDKLANDCAQHGGIMKPFSVTLK